MVQHAAWAASIHVVDADLADITCIGRSGASACLSGDMPAQQ